VAIPICLMIWDIYRIFYLAIEESNLIAATRQFSELNSRTHRDFDSSSRSPSDSSKPLHSPMLSRVLLRDAPARTARDDDQSERDNNAGAGTDL